MQSPSAIVFSQENRPAGVRQGAPKMRAWRFGRDRASAGGSAFGMAVLIPVWRQKYALNSPRHPHPDAAGRENPFNIPRLTVRGGGSHNLTP